MYFHFRSKHELALAIIEHQSLMGYESMSEVLSRKLSGLETLVAMWCLIVTRDIGDDVARAGLNLLESIGRADGVKARVLGEWANAVAEVVRRANAEGDVIAIRDAETSAAAGWCSWATTDDPRRRPPALIADLEKAWAPTPPASRTWSASATSTSSIRALDRLVMTKAKTSSRPRAAAGSARWPASTGREELDHQRLRWTLQPRSATRERDSATSSSVLSQKGAVRPILFHRRPATAIIEDGRKHSTICFKEHRRAVRACAGEHDPRRLRGREPHQHRHHGSDWLGTPGGNRQVQRCQPAR